MNFKGSTVFFSPCEVIKNGRVEIFSSCVHFVVSILFNRVSFDALYNKHPLFFYVTEIRL